MEKYGFVYIWRDRKHLKYYIGCRWGREDDGYICSSDWMKKAYARRPQDFKRRILARVYTNRNDLLMEEYKWLRQIKPDELGKRYYNFKANLTGPGNTFFGRKHTEETKRKMSLSAKKRPANRKGVKHTEEANEKNRIAHLGNTYKRDWVLRQKAK